MGAAPTDRARQRPRVMHVITLASVGGAQNQVALLLPALAEEFEVVVTAHGRGPLSEATEAAGAEFVPLRWMRRELGWRDAVALVELIALMRRMRPDVVHVTSSKAGVLGRLAAAATRVPVRVFTVQGWSFTPYSGLKATAACWIERVLGPLTTVMVCPSETAKAEGVESGACRPDQAVVIPNAVEIGAPRPPLPERAMPTIIAVGRLQPQKDMPTLVRALALLPRGSFRAQVAGDGPDRRMLEGELERLGLGGAVELLGGRDDVPDLLAEADVFALSSRWEVLPLSILEAMGAGLPVVATAVGGVPELVSDGETGILVPPGQPGALARALDRLILDPGLRRRLGEAGRRRVETEFDLGAVRAAHVALYRGALA